MAGRLRSKWNWRVALDKCEGVVKNIVVPTGAEHQLVSQEGLNPRLWKSHAQSPAVEDRSTNH
jgi:hypothetical protein